MKWTKFKDEIPQDNFVYITNFVSTWVSFEMASWKEYTKHHPDYAWCKIPILRPPFSSDEVFLDRLFSYHISGGIDVDRFFKIREHAKEFARSILKIGGESGQEDLMRSIESIRLAVFYATSPIETRYE